MERLIDQVLNANRELPAHQLVLYTWGNVSAIDRSQGLIAIKPSGIPYEKLLARHIVVLDLDGKVITGTYRASSDTAAHLALYNRFESIGGIVHTRSRWATIWAQAGEDLPVYGTSHADHFDGAIPCTRRLNDDEIRGEYESNIGKVILETFEQRQLDPKTIPAVLVSGHAPFTWGADAAEAVVNAVVLEECAMMAWHTRLLQPAVQPISAELLNRHYLRKHGKSAYYGQKLKG
jgi:L-ribulose-5-phosphate 4-epimerase